MKALKFYGYDKCGTCRKAKQYLSAKKIPFDDIDITLTPPPSSLLKAILKRGDYRLGDLLNTSGERYRALNMKEKLRTLSEDDVIALLAREGRLAKRPIVTDGATHTVGYREEIFRKTWR